MLLKAITRLGLLYTSRKYVGHGVGRNLHESPDVPNYGTAGHGIRLAAGMTLAIEPMVNAKGEDVKVMKDGWTVKTVSGSLSAHLDVYKRQMYSRSC